MNELFENSVKGADGTILFQLKEDILLYYFFSLLEVSYYFNVVF